MNNYSTSFLLKNIIKQLVWKTLSFYKHGKLDDVAIFSSRRSGSTFLMEIISSSPRVRYLDQPYSVYSNPIHFSQYVYPVFQGHITSIENEEISERLYNYTEKLIKGEYIVSAPWNPFRPTFHFFTNRVVLKILSAKSIIDWFSEKFDMKIIFLTRHPIPQSLSCIRNRWGLDCKAFLLDDIFCEKWLHNGLYDYSWKIFKEGSLFEKHILEWVLENLVPLRIMSQYPEWVILSYEYLVTNGESLIRDLAECLSLSNYNKMISRLNKPSISSKISKQRTKEIITNVWSDKVSLIDGWKKNIKDEQIHATSKILERFEIDIYNADEAFPMKIHQMKVEK